MIVDGRTNVILTFNGSNNFINNSAVYYGGAIYTNGNPVLTFNGTNYFINNSAVYYHGGAICTHGNAVLTFTGTNNFIGNSVEEFGGGAIYVTNNAVLTFFGINNFINNSANGPISDGGAIGTSTSGNAVLIFNGTNNFTGNSANYRGGVIYAKFNTSLTFTVTTGFSNNSANDDGGAIYAEAETLLKFTGISDFITNTAYNGGAISTHDFVVITFTGTIGNSAMKSGAISANLVSKPTFDAILTMDMIAPMQIMKLAKEVQYIWLFVSHSSFYPTQQCWENNHATLGGAIYVSDVNPQIYCTLIAPYIAAYVPREECFFQLPGQSLSSGINVKLVFKNNTADDAGSVLYGGTIDKCKLTYIVSSRKVFGKLVHIEDDADYNTTSKISSEPFHMCTCKYSLLDCGSFTDHDGQVYPGETFQVSVVAVGQRDRTVSSTVRSRAITNSIDSRPANLLDYQYLQQTTLALTSTTLCFHCLRK